MKRLTTPVDTGSVWRFNVVPFSLKFSRTLHSTGIPPGQRILSLGLNSGNHNSNLLGLYCPDGVDLRKSAARHAWPVVCVINEVC